MSDKKLDTNLDANIDANLDVNIQAANTNFNANIEAANVYPCVEDKTLTMDTKPLVSVLMPAYNASQFIDEAIKSILDQSYTNFELIILDDCSTDNTLEIISNYAKQDYRVKVYHNETNQKIVRSRNRLFELAKGEFYVIHDADDISVISRIEDQLELMLADNMIGVCGGFLQSFNAERNLDIRKYETDDLEIRKRIFKSSPLAQPSCMIRKEAIDQCGMYSEDFPVAEDIELWYRIGLKYKFANVPKILLYYREQENNATHKKMKSILHYTLKARKKYKNEDAYNFTFSDALAYFATWFMQILPTKLVIFLFKFLRKLLVIKNG